MEEPGGWRAGWVMGAVPAKGLQRGFGEAGGCTGDRPGRHRLGAILKGLERQLRCRGAMCLVRRVWIQEPDTPELQFGAATYYPGGLGQII